MTSSADCIIPPPPILTPPPASNTPPSTNQPISTHLASPVISSSQAHATPETGANFAIELICLHCDIARSIGCICSPFAFRAIRVFDNIPRTLLPARVSTELPSSIPHSPLSASAPGGANKNMERIPAHITHTCPTESTLSANPSETWEEFFAESAFDQSADARV